MNNRIVWGLLLCLPCAMAWGQNTNCWVNGNYVSCTEAPSAQRLMQQQQAQQEAKQEQQAQQQQLFNQQIQQIQQNAYQQQQLDLQRQQVQLEQQRLQQAQSQPSQQSLVQPSDVDLKAAYCVGVINVGLATEEAQIKNWGHDDNASFQALKSFVQMAMDRTNQSRDRLLAYLKPRMSNMDMSTLLGAKEQGEDDAEKADMYSNKVCSPKCGKLNGDALLKCTDSCEANSEPYQHVKICASLSFLPY